MNHLHDIAREINNDLAKESSMAVGKTLKHPDGRTVKIKSGAYLRNGRLSNFWYWNEVLPNGRLGPVEHGYGW